MLANRTFFGPDRGIFRPRPRFFLGGGLSKNVFE
jgi:hypothetical protein